MTVRRVEKAKLIEATAITKAKNDGGLKQGTMTIVVSMVKK